MGAAWLVAAAALIVGVLGTLHLVGLGFHASHSLGVLYLGGLAAAWI